MMEERANWAHRGEYTQARHSATPKEANEALADPSRIAYHPDYNSNTGRTDRIIGYSHTAGTILTVIVLNSGGDLYGVNAWPANARDCRSYREGITQ